MTDVLHGDTWEVRDGRAVVVGSNRWPAPKPGSHESDLYGGEHWPRGCLDSMLPGEKDSLRGRGAIVEFNRAAAWSRANQEETTS